MVVNDVGVEKLGMKLDDEEEEVQEDLSVQIQEDLSLKVDLVEQEISMKMVEEKLDNEEEEEKIGMGMHE